MHYLWVCLVNSIVGSSEPGDVGASTGASTSAALVLWSVGNVIAGVERENLGGCSMEYERPPSAKACVG